MGSATKNSLVAATARARVENSFARESFVDFKMAEESGYVRFEQQEDAQKALAAAEEGDLVVKDCIMCVELVTVAFLVLPASHGEDDNAFLTVSGSRPLL
ncbi:hypothetical protein AAC387_Pa05g1624 [Persea americana]